MTSEQLTESQAPPFSLSSFLHIIMQVTFGNVFSPCRNKTFRNGKRSLLSTLVPIMPFMLPVSFLKWIRELRLSIRKRMKGRILQEKVE